MLFQYYGGAPGLQQAFYWLQQYGIVDVFLPFVLIFAVFYAILTRVGYFKTRINAVLSLTISLLVVVPHIIAPTQTSVVSIINRMLPGAALIAVLLVTLAMLTGLASKPGEFWPKFGSFAPWIAVVGLGIALWAAFSPTSWYGPLRWIQDPALITVLVVLAIAAIVIYFITKEPPTTRGGGGGGQQQGD